MTELPPLPEPDFRVYVDDYGNWVETQGQRGKAAWFDDAVRAYAAAAVAKERERLIAILNASVETTWREAAAEEQERCAQLCEEQYKIWMQTAELCGGDDACEISRAHMAEELAAAIRGA